MEAENNEEVNIKESGGCQAEEGKHQVDEAHVQKKGRREEVDYMVKELLMFEFGSWQEAVSRGGKEPTHEVGRSNKKER